MAWTGPSLWLQGRPSPHVPCCPHHSRASRTAASAFILRGYHLCRVCLPGPHRASGSVGSGTKGLAGGFPGPRAPQLQPQTMDLTLAPRPGTGPGMVISHPDSRGGGGEVTAAAGGVSCPPERLRPSLVASALQCRLVSPRPMSPPETQVRASAMGVWPRGPSSCRPLSGTINHESAASSPGALLRAFRSEIQLWCSR